MFFLGVKKMVDVTTHNTEINDIIVDRAIIGRKVFAKTGEEIGVVKELFINPKNFSVKAINVYKGPFKFEHYIGREYIENFGTDGIILNIIPLEDIVGKKVIDSDGREIGKVKGFDKLELTNKMLSLIISPGVTKDNFVIGPKEIKRIEKSVMLNKSFKELEKK
jgi:sporulation protein YlmC with PRC-barrel domain